MSQEETLRVSREAFEDQIFQHRFIQSIGQARPEEQRVVGLPVGISRNCPAKLEFCRKDAEGNYVDPFVAGAWWVANNAKMEGLEKHRAALASIAKLPTPEGRSVGAVNSWYVRARAIAAEALK